MILKARHNGGQPFVVKGEPAIGALGIVDWKKLSNSKSALFFAGHNELVVTSAAPLTLHFRTGAKYAYTQIVVDAIGGDVRIEAWKDTTCSGNGSAVLTPAHCMNLVDPSTPSAALYVSPTISDAGDKYYDDLILMASGGAVSARSSATLTGQEDYKRALSTSYIIRVTPINAGNHRAAFKMSWVETDA